MSKKAPRAFSFCAWCFLSALRNRRWLDMFGVPSREQKPSTDTAPREISLLAADWGSLLAVLPVYRLGPWWLCFFSSPRGKMSSLITNERSAESSELQLRRQSLLRESLLCTWDHFEKTDADDDVPAAEEHGGWEVGTAVTLRTCTSMLKWLFELPCNHLCLSSQTSLSIFLWPLASTRPFQSYNCHSLDIFFFWPFSVKTLDMILLSSLFWWNFHKLSSPRLHA